MFTPTPLSRGGQSYCDKVEPPAFERARPEIPQVGPNILLEGSPVRATHPAISRIVRRPTQPAAEKANWAGLGAMRQPAKTYRYPGDTTQRDRISGTLIDAATVKIDRVLLLGSVDGTP